MTNPECQYCGSEVERIEASATWKGEPIPGIYEFKCKLCKHQWLPAKMEAAIDIFIKDWQSNRIAELERQVESQIKIIDWNGEANLKLEAKIKEIERERDELRAEIKSLQFNLEQKAGEIGRAEHRGNTVNYIYDKYENYERQLGEHVTKVATLTKALRSAESTLALMAEGEGNRAEVYQRMSKAELADVRAALAKAGV